MKSLLICAIAMAPLLYPNPAIAFCSKPIVPYCASDGDLNDRYISRAECREQVEDHLDALAIYRSCLGNVIKQIDEDARKLRKLIGPDTHELRCRSWKSPSSNAILSPFSCVDFRTIPSGEGEHD